MNTAPTITLGLAQSPEDLKGIKALQTANLKTGIAPKDLKKTGFVTAAYSLALLEKMNAYYPAVIAKMGPKVVGYALVVDHQIRGQHDLLDDLLTQIDNTHYQGQLLAHSRYVVVGQLCVAQEVRGQGLAQKLYQQFKTSYRDRFTFCVTDVDHENLPSLRAHEKTGFQKLGTLTYGGSDWSIVLWDW